MKNYKEELLEKICYTDLVYERINKKLNLNLSKSRIEEMIFLIIQETNEANYQKIGKNVYISNNENNVRLTINSYTNRIITVEKLSVVP
jgi:FKBP-type peptidyl-prolyl cis-trans isomerase (trigger factor)